MRDNENRIQKPEVRSRKKRKRKRESVDEVLSLFILYSDS
jgi:hypothetical protein